MFIGLDQFEWRNDSWAAAPGCFAMFDCAGREQIAAAKPGQPRGWLLGAWQDKPAGFDDRGGIAIAVEDLRDARPTDRTRRIVGRALGFRPAGDTLGDWLFSVLTRGADPLQCAGPGILEPTHTGSIEIRSGALALYAEFAKDDPYWTKLRSALRSRLSTERLLALQGQFVNPVTGRIDFRYHLRIADALLEKYAGAHPDAKMRLWSELKPAAWERDEEPLPHCTTITDGFNRANQNNLGTSSEGWSWSELGTGRLDIVSLAAKHAFQGSQSVNRADSDLSSADHYAQWSQTIRGGGSTTGGGPMVRKDSSSTLTYYHMRLMGSGSDNVELYKVVAGTFTQLGSDTSVAVSLPDPLRLTCSGSSIKATYDGVDKITQTDTAIASGTRCGIRSQESSASFASFDDFEAGDVTPSGGPFPHYISRRMHGGMIPMGGGL